MRLILFLLAVIGLVMAGLASIKTSKHQDTLPNFNGAERQRMMFQAETEQNERLGGV